MSPLADSRFFVVSSAYLDTIAICSFWYSRYFSTKALVNSTFAGSAAGPGWLPEMRPRRSILRGGGRFIGLLGRA